MSNAKHPQRKKRERIFAAVLLLLALGFAGFFIWQYAEDRVAVGEQAEQPAPKRRAPVRVAYSPPRDDAHEKSGLPGSDRTPLPATPQQPKPTEPQNGVHAKDEHAHEEHDTGPLTKFQRRLLLGNDLLDWRREFNRGGGPLGSAEVIDRVLARWPDVLRSDGGISEHNLLKRAAAGEAYIPGDGLDAVLAWLLVPPRDVKSFTLVMSAETREALEKRVDAQLAFAALNLPANLSNNAPQGTLTLDENGLPIEPRKPAHPTLTPELAKALAVGALVRVWTGDGYFPVDAITDAERTLRYVAMTTQTENALARGFDIVATPEMGDDRFPVKRAKPGVAGAYLHDDKFMVMYNNLVWWYMAPVLTHELIHAYTHELGADFESSRFINEGLAEYLRLCKPEDIGLSVPVERLANELADLESRLTEIEALAGFDDKFLKRMVRLPPQDFYGWSDFAYLLAQAAMAYIGGETIERALKDRTDKPIAEALEPVEWKDFRAWVKQGAAGGNPDLAITVTEPYTGNKVERQFADLVRSGGLLSIGKRVEEETLRQPIARSRTRLKGGGLERDMESVIRFIGTMPAREKLLLVTEATVRMDLPFSLLLPDASFLAPLQGGSLSSGTARAFVDSLYTELGRVRGGSNPLFVSVIERPEFSEVPLKLYKGDFTLGRLPEWMANAGHKDTVTIFCIASVDEESREIAREALRLEKPKMQREGNWRDFADTELATLRYVSLLQKHKVKPRAAMVIDLGNGLGDAMAFAKALDEVMPRHIPLVYWRPQADDVVTRGKK